MDRIYVVVYTPRQELNMAFARVFQSGNSQAVRLPKEFRLTTDKVEIFRRGDEVVMREVPVNAGAIFDALASLPDDFMEEGRNDTPPQDRDDL
jgi:antitoxin VapB